MKIDKAIEILNDILRYVKPGDPPEEHEAMKLGVEALKRLKYHREIWTLAANELLPGEDYGIST